MRALRRSSLGSDAGDGVLGHNEGERWPALGVILVPRSDRK